MRDLIEGTISNDYIVQNFHTISWLLTVQKIAKSFEQDFKGTTLLYQRCLGVSTGALNSPPIAGALGAAPIRGPENDSCRPLVGLNSGIPGLGRY